jgi:hypothetical protein
VHPDIPLTFYQRGKDTARCCETSFEGGKLILTASSERFGWNARFQHITDLKYSLLQST